MAIHGLHMSRFSLHHVIHVEKWAPAEGGIEKYLCCFYILMSRGFGTNCWLKKFNRYLEPTGRKLESQEELLNAKRNAYR